MSAPTKAPAVTVFYPTTAFRVHHSPSRAAHGLYLSSAEDGWHLVHPQIVGRHTIPNLCHGNVYQAMLADGTPFLLPVVAPIEYPGLWFASLKRALPMARRQWVTIEPDIARTAFIVRPAPQTPLQDAEWPKRRFIDLLEQAFAGRIAADWRDVVTELWDEHEHKGLNFPTRRRAELQAILEHPKTKARGRSPARNVGAPQSSL